MHRNRLFTLALLIATISCPAWGQDQLPSTDAVKAALLHQKGLADFDKGNYAKALEHYQQALIIRRKLHTEPHADLAQTLHQIGVVYDVQERYAKATHYYQQALELRQKLYDGAHPDLAQTLNNLGWCHYNLDQNGKALKCYEHALAMRRKLFRGSHADVAFTLHNIGLVYEDQHDYAKALEYYQQALAMRQQLEQKSYLHVGVSWNAVGWCYHKLGQNHKAIDAYKEALASYQKLSHSPQANAGLTWHNLGLAYYDEKQYTRSLEAYRQALAIRQQLYDSKPRADLAWTLHNIGVVYYDQRQYAKALEYYQQALTMRRKLYDKPHADLGYSLNNIGVVYEAQGDYAKALEYYQQALGIRRKLSDKPNANLAQTLNNIGCVYRRQGQYPKALDFLRQALTMREKVFDKPHNDIAESMNGLANVYLAQGELARARKLHQQALELYKQLHGERHPSVANSLMGLALVCHAQRDLTQARKLCQQALDLYKQIHGERHPDVATSLSNLALVYHDQRDLAQARKLHQQALELRRQLFGERHPSVAASLNNLAGVCQDLGELTQARKLCQQALELRREIHGDRHPDVATSLNNLAVICQDQGDLPQARKLHQQALELLKQLHGERHPSVAASLNNLAVICHAQGDLAQARKLCQQALDLKRQLHGERHPDVATSLTTLALVCKAQGDLPQTRKLHQQALDLYKQIHGERHPDVAISLNNLAVVCHAQGDLPSAVRFWTEAVLACRLPGVKHEKLVDLHPQDLTCDAGTVTRLHRLGWVLQLAGKGDDAAAAHQAATAYALAADLLDRLRADVLDTEEGKLFQGAHHAALVPARVGLAATLFGLDGKADDLHTAFAALEQGRARVFLQALAQARSRQIGGVSGSLLDRERDLLAYLRGLDASIQKENTKTLDKRNADLVKYLYDQRKEKEAELNRLVQRMRKEHPQYAALQYPRPCSLQEARDCLHANEVAVLFALHEKQSWAVVVQKTLAPGDKGKGVAVVPLPGAQVLAGKVRTLVDREVLKSDSRTRCLGAELHDLLFKPLAKHIGGKNLVLVPDGVLWELPFELLVEGRAEEDEGKYLIESRQIRYSPSLTVLHLIGQWEEKRTVPREALWALADPVFSKDDPRAKGDLSRPTRDLLELYARRSASGDSFAPLPGTRREVEAIARLHGAKKGDVVLDDLANEKVLKGASSGEVLSRKRYVHLATHGILGSQLGRPPSLVLSLVGNDGAEQGGGVNDGFLSFIEVTHLKLNADLVVLSACETGKGDLRPGEGVVGLSRSFLYAGSRGVVCSLWQVDDARTAVLMESLYNELRKGKVSSAEALALARRKLIAEEQAPFYWAPFILIGK